MRTVKAVVAEDEPILRETLVRTLAALWPELAIVAEVADGVAAIRAMDEHAPEVVFLDIQMPGMTGLEVAQQLNGRCHVAFVTAYDEYAVTAFEQGAVDYVMKPISPARLSKTVSRLKAKLGSAPTSLDGIMSLLSSRLTAKDDRLRWITVTHGSDLDLITVDEVIYFKADHKYTVVVTAIAETPIRLSVKELVDRLDPAAFWQIHRGTIVNANAVAGVTRDYRGHMLVKLKQRKETLLVSESYVHLFKGM